MQKYLRFEQIRILEILNKNFNLMIDRLKNQQDKLIINERHEAWGSLAQENLAHEIKNPSNTNSINN